MPNIYYNPGEFGLEVVAEIEYSTRCYQFDTRVVWRKIGTKQLFTARDSGCSCPTPFEDYNLTNIDRVSISQLRDEVNYQLGLHGKSNITPDQAQEFLLKVRNSKNGND